MPAWTLASAEASMSTSNVPSSASRSAGLRTSPCTNVTPSERSLSRFHSEPRRRRLSNTTTELSVASCRKYLASAPPTNPAPPVIRKFIQTNYLTNAVTVAEGAYASEIPISAQVRPIDRCQAPLAIRRIQAFARKELFVEYAPGAGYDRVARRFGLDHFLLIHSILTSFMCRKHFCCTHDILV